MKNILKNLNNQKKRKKIHEEMKNTCFNLFHHITRRRKSIKTTTQSRLWFSSSTISQLERIYHTPQGSLVEIQQALSANKTELMAQVPTDDFYIGAVFMFCRVRARSITARKKIYSTFIDQHNFTFLLSRSLPHEVFIHIERDGNALQEASDVHLKTLILIVIKIIY